MSTRSVIAEVKGDGFEGVYAHFDGYPTARGPMLWQAQLKLGTPEALIEYAIKPGQRGYWSSFAPPSCRVEDDGAGFAPSWVPGETLRVSSDGPDRGTEWAYVISNETLRVFVRRFGTPDNDLGYGLGMFGLGASDTVAGGYWKLIGAYRWDQDEPDWAEIEKDAGEG